jgi:beta-glucosidase
VRSEASEPAVPEARASRIDDAVARLDLPRKVRLLTGASTWRTAGEPLIGLREMVLSDGPAGVRGESWDERRTSVNLPSPTALAATWDERLVERAGALLASEARRKGVDVLLAPGVNLHRSPLGGRHFEYLSEDPLLSGRIGSAFVRGVQGAGIAATAKHYLANESETERRTVDVRVDERTLREVYLAPFEVICREAGAWCVMAAYNAVNGTPMTESPLLAEPLKGEWGFDGVVMSDWGATYSTEASARAALDLVMPGGRGGPWGERLVAAVVDGRVPEEVIDDKVRRVLLLAARVGALEGVPPAVAPPAHEPTREEAGALARDAAAAGMVLVRNAVDTLPLDRHGLRRVAVIGPSAVAPRTQGGGSAAVSPPYVVSPVQGLAEALGAGVEVTHAAGVRIREGLEAVTLDQVRDPVTGGAGVRVRYLDAAGVSIQDEHRLAGRLVWIGDPIIARASALEIEALLRVTATGPYDVGVGGTGRVRLELDGTVLVDEHIDREQGLEAFASVMRPPERSRRVDLDAAREVHVRVRREIGEGEVLLSVTLGLRRADVDRGAALAEAARLAEEADVAIVVVGTTDQIETEGFDRASLALPGAQDELVTRIVEANPRTVVVVNAGGPVLMPWRHEAPAVLLTWFGGQEYGSALADVLLGDREPGGRLPTTWPARQEDVPVLGTTPVDGVLEYREGVHIGYRAWARAAAPAYPFGHGLGYTSWEYVALDAPAEARPREEIVVRVRVRNGGIRRRGREVVQVYVSRAESAVDRPELWLGGFAAVEAEPGEEAWVDVVLPPRVLEHWDDARGWTVEPGAFDVHAGSSAADLPLDGSLVITTEAPAPDRGGHEPGRS